MCLEFGDSNKIIRAVLKQPSVESEGILGQKHCLSLPNILLEKTNQHPKVLRIHGKA